MRRFTIWGGLFLALASAATAQDLRWERVGTLPGQFSASPDWAHDGRLWAIGRGTLQRLDAPYDSTQVWQPVGSRIWYSGSPILALGQDTVVVLNHPRFARTTNNGASFTEMQLEGGAQGPAVAIPFGLPHGGSLVVPGRANATSGRYGGYSRDRGATWISSTIPGHDGEHPRASALVVVPRGPRAGRVVSIGHWGLAASDDGGATYAAIQPWWGVYRFSSTGALAVLTDAAPGGGDRLVASFYDNSDPEIGSFVYVSDDGGDTWRRTFLLTGDPNSAASVAVDLGAGQALILMNGGHVWRTADAGETWSQIGVVPGTLMDTGAANPVGRVHWAKLGPDGRLYVGGTNLGRDIEVGFGWMLRSSVPLAVASAALPDAPDPASLAVMPNPSVGASTVHLRLPEASREVRVEVLDTSGRRVVTLHAGALAAGDHAFPLVTSGWAAGVYVVRVARSGRVERRLLTITR